METSDVRILIVCATTINDNKVLLVRHADIEKLDYGDWLFPVGRVEPGEWLEGTLKREMMEETGLRVIVARKLVEHVDPYTGERSSNSLCLPSTSSIETSSELMDARWFDVSDIRRLDDINPGLKEFLIDGFEGAPSFN